jgi:glycosyltransferase involved in cell wall biosynthesis
LRQLSIAIFGNTNNYPLSLAEGLISLGHSVRLILNRKELLHRPEARHPEWAASYPDWIVDYSDITDEDIACEMPVIEHLLQHLTNEVDLVILNDVGPALAGYLQSPYVVALTGSDLSFYANFDSLQTRTASWDAQFKRSPQGRKLMLCLTDLVGRQRDGILGAEVVCYGHRGLVPAADRLLDGIGVMDDQRMMLHLSNVDRLRARPLPGSEKLIILCGSRIVYRPEENPGLSAIDFKGTDVLIRGFAQYCQRGGQGELRLPKKGQDLDAARLLIDDLGIADRIAWLPDMPLADFYEEMAKAHLICDQFGTSFPGMVTTDAYAIGRPVMANLRNEVFSLAFSKLLPGFDVKTSDEIADCLLRIENDRELLSRVGLESRAYAERFLSPEVVAGQLMSKCLLHQRKHSPQFGRFTDRRSSVDFSSSLRLAEDYKNVLATMSLKESSLTQLMNSVDASVQDYKRQLPKFDPIDAVLGSSAKLNVFQKIKFRLDLLFHHFNLIMALHSISHDMAHRFEELAHYTQRQLKLTLSLGQGDGQQAVQTNLSAEQQIAENDSSELMGGRTSV